MADYGPSIPVCRLWEKVSAKGTRYLSGRIGGIRVSILPNRDYQNEGDATHTMLFSEAPSRDRQGEG
jgi:hypothetical protein